ncbi:MAG: 50S ribosomal protein L13 [Patescibacteria group bacterium]|nr:50S ribosomal protein L13 [Patescibacteria group bacterium]
MKNKEIIDANNKPLGRLASQVAIRLMGKDQPNYQPHKPGNLILEVKNASKIKLTGLKSKNKVFYKYSGYQGGVKQKKLSVLMKKDPSSVLKMAVKGMLPHNRLLKHRLKRLKISN